ncbi:MAG: glycosyltransferase [Polyangiales bacterium]
MATVDPTEQEGVISVAKNGRLLTHVAAFGLHLRDGAGGVVGQLPDDVIAVAKTNGLSLFEIVDDVRGDAPHPAETNALGRDPSLIRTLSQNLRHKLEADGARGVLLSLGEDDADLDGSLRAKVLAGVHAELQPTGYVVGVLVEGRLAPEALAQQAKIADLVVVRAYRGLDPTSSPTPLAARAWVERTVDEVAAIVPANKLVVMLGTRAAAWPVRANLASAGHARELQWAEVIARARVAKITPLWEPRSANLVLALPGPTGVASSAHVRSHPDDDGTVAMLAWAPDAATFADQLLALRQRGLVHVALGTVGGEDPRIWKVLAVAPDDRESMRTALSALPTSSDPDVVGEGLAMEVDLSEHEGQATIELGAGGRIHDERYEVLPAAPTVIRRGKLPNKTVLLTFDDGPHPDWTPHILAILREEAVKATFFAVGSRAERDPELLRRLVAEGHEVGNHSFSHPDLGKITDQRADFEINSMNRLVEALTGKGTVLFRPPFRSDDRPTVREDLLAIQHGDRNGMITVTSNIDPHDWARATPDIMIEHVLRRLEREGSGVILMHDGGGDRANTVVALRPLIRAVKARGFAFKQIHDVFGDPSLASVNAPVQRNVVDDVGRGVWSTGTWFLRVMTGLAIFALAIGLFRFVTLVIGALLDVIIGWRARQEIRRTSRLPRQLAVSVVIPAYNEAKVIERTILSVLASRGVDVEVLVMDDGSKDGTGDVVARGFSVDPRVKLHRLQNGGKSRALNIGFELASHEIVVALDADTIFLPDTIVEMARRFDDPRVAAVAGRCAVGNTQHFVARWQALEYLVGQAIERRAWHVLGIVSVVPGAVGAWGRGPVLEAGGFGTDTLAEDCDLTLDLQVRGWKVAYAPEAVALTEAPETLHTLLKQRFRWCFGILQTMWKRRWAMLRPPKGNRAIGIVLLPCVLACHIATPLLGPLADGAALIAIGLGHGKAVVPYAVALLIAEFLVTVLALRIDRGCWSLMKDWPINRTAYRWLLFLALWRATKAALRGGEVGWDKLIRTGAVQAPMPGIPSSPEPDTRALTVAERKAG